LRAGRAPEAERLLDEGLQRLATDNRPRTFGEEALWYLKRGAARVALDRRQEAEADLRRALGLESRKWVAGRAHGELGKLADLRGDRATARGEFQRAAALAEEDNDSSGAAAAERWVDTPYRRGHR
jgi:tetratricopeptide (TPR) repeat protein